MRSFNQRLKSLNDTGRMKDALARREEELTQGDQIGGISYDTMVTIDNGEGKKEEQIQKDQSIVQ